VITVQIGDRLRVRKAHLPPGHEDAIKQRLTIANGEKAAALKRQQWGARDMVDFFTLYEDAGEWLVMPRGYAAELRAGLKSAGYDVEWDNKTSATMLQLREMVYEGPNLRPEQVIACDSIIEHRQGVLQAPTAAGKTVVVLEAWRRTGLKGLVLVEKAGLAKQWIERAKEHLGIDVGLIGEGEWEEKPLTVAMMQTLRRRELSPFWWRRWGFTAIDEAHHVQAETYQHLVRQIWSSYLIGVTATPLEGMWEQPFLTHTLGPIFHITTPEQLRQAGLRVAPQITRVHTGWRWVPANQREEDLVDTKTIYRYIIKALEQEPRRVLTIAQKIVEQPAECAQLVLAKRLGYLELIAEALERQGYTGEIYMMRGQESSDRRTEIGELAEQGNCVILSTVADEGTDIPRLDRLHLVWPQKKELTITQQIGRVLRTHPDKRGVVVFDYVDREGMLANQARLRAGIYHRAGYSVEDERLQSELTV
jgi:superfamily II DNA or RNA helicase